MKAALSTVTTDRLRQISVFEGLSEEELCWFLDQSEPVVYAKNELVFDVGDPVDYLFVLLEGKVQVLLPVSGQMTPIVVHMPDSVTGILPYSRLKTAPGKGLVLKDATLLRLHKRHFPKMASVSPELVARLVDHMKDRVREGERREAQQSKLRALAKLSAGLAHELNNPASAIKRNAQGLTEILAELPVKSATLAAQGLDTTQIGELNRLLAIAEGLIPGAKLSLMERSAREDRLVDFLQANAAEDPYALAESFCAIGFEPEHLQETFGNLPEQARSAAFDWLEATLSARQLVEETETAAGRISSLLESLKSYSQMDRAQEMKPVNLKESLQSTLDVLAHRISVQRVQLEVDWAEDLPLVNAFAADLNQVWTGLLENALDAVEGQAEGRVRIVGKRVGSYATVLIRDNGGGIPEKVRPQIYEPFFTTKGVGRTGLGLDMVVRVLRAHEGSICCDSAEGQTEFRVDLPALD